MSKPIKVLVVDDSATVRAHLCDLINEQDDLIVTGEAKNGVEAIEMTHKLRPDVISMDINMPVMDGLEAVRQIMQNEPIPIVVVTSNLNQAEVNLAFNALQAGALAVIEKPPVYTHPDFDFLHDQMLSKLRSMAAVAVVRRRPSQTVEKTPPPLAITHKLPTGEIQVVGIASSTGGPSALVEILGNLPANFAQPIVIVQHISQNFEDGLIEWLNRSSPLEISLARHGQQLQSGHVIIAPSGFHLSFGADGRIVLDARRNDYLNMPSADVMLASLASVFGNHALGIVLTGMGSDGARGLRAVAETGAQTIAQDEASSVVFGMPKEAIACGAARHVVSLRNIAPAILKLVQES